MLGARAICFALPASTGDAATDQRARDGIHLCEQGAKSQGVQVAALGTPGCLTTSLVLSVRQTDQKEPVCQYGVGMRVNCVESGVLEKLAHVTVYEQPESPPVTEATAALRSTDESFSERDYRELCRAAFYRWPQAIRDRLDVAVDR